MGVPTLQIDGHRATIELQRPDKRNRIEPDDLVELLELFDRIVAEPDVRVVVLKSSGPIFCAGFHLGALADGTRSPVSFGEMCDRLASLPMPSIAQIEGGIHGGGTDLALSCDFRIAADDIELVMPAARLGLQYYASGLQRFVARIGPSASKRLFLTALPADAPLLLRVGYLDELHPRWAIPARVEELATAVAALGPEAVARTKAAINGLADGSMTLEQADASAKESMRSAEHREGVKAMSEKRPPSFAPSTLRPVR
ncbi:MAG: enoyl-CoA hydratase/isomerase family protein [Acidimicrobiales bacterium]|nr:enoyl-CoA hydratase/isomerase family protein [Acidimicrobiales bacterium]